jgi:hypothetical protein
LNSSHDLQSTLTLWRGGAGVNGGAEDVVDWDLRNAMKTALTDLSPDPVIEAYKKDVDRTLIRENLKRTPEERVRNLMALQQAVEELRQAGKRAKARR